MTATAFTPLQSRIIAAVEERLPAYQEAALAIHARPETSDEEVFASSTLIGLLEKEGFAVEKGVAGHRTGFIARYRSARPGPVIGMLAEYDALPGMGHACGHNILGCSASLAGVALKAAIDEAGGEVR
ncbi:MAG: amidohydrolase, partial [Duodenibacillus sp.]|nr:amidohydrolase [Duodenibacillus sp.]